jgi:threonine aldolase
VIDLRSDTVTRPTPAMRAAMTNAEVGDDVYGEDPTVNRLQVMTCERLGFEAAIFVPSGTQSNLCALLTHCGRGDEYVVGQMAHAYRYEGGGAAIVGGIQPQPLEFEADGTLDLDKVAAVIKPDDPHFTKTRLLCLENTQWGKTLPLDYLQRAVSFARSKGLSLHLDGARIFNASVAHHVDVRDITRGFDSVSVCLSKGLGAPVGSVLCGSKHFIEQAHRWRKVVGGGMRQAGIVAAAGIVALEEQVDRLAEDHAHAAILADGLTNLDEVTVDGPYTNMVFLTLNPTVAQDLKAYVHRRGIIVAPTFDRLRLVTHLDVSAEDVTTVVTAFKEFFAARKVA